MFLKDIFFLSIKCEVADESESVLATVNTLCSRILPPWKMMCATRVFICSTICELMKKSSLISSNDGQTSKALEIVFGSDKHPEGWPLIQAIQTPWVSSI